MNRVFPLFTVALLIIPMCATAQNQGQNLESVLLDAASAGQTEIVKSFLDRGANLEVKNELGATPLIFASAKGQSPVVALLLDRGANVNAKTSTGITPLMAAASGGHVDIVKLLLAKSADVCAKDQQGRSALSMAEASGDSQVTDLLKSAEKSCAPEKPRVASRDASPSRQRSVETSDSGSADSETSEQLPDLSQGSDQSPAGQQGGPLGDLLNNPIIQQAMSQILGGQTSAPAPMGAVQSPDVQGNVPNQPPGQAAQNQLPAQGANAQGNAQNQPPAQGANAQNQGTAKANDPNLVVTPFTNNAGFVGTKTFNRTTQETEIRGTRTDPQTGVTTKFDQTLDKSGAIKSGTSISTVPTQGGGVQIIKQKTVNGATTASVTDVSAKGDSFKTTNFDSTGNKTSDRTVRPSGSSTIIKYAGTCTKDGGPGCHMVSAVDKDPKTGKMTTTTYDPADGHVTGTKVTDIPKKAQQNAATLKAGPNNLTGNNQHSLKANKQNNLAGAKDKLKTDVSGKIKSNLAGNDHKGLHANKQQGLTGANKEQVKADVLGQIEGKPAGDVKGTKDKFKTHVSGKFTNNSGAAAGLNPQPLPPGSPTGKVGAKTHFDNKFSAGSNKKNRKEDFFKDAATHGGNVKEKVIPQSKFSNQFSEGSKRKSQSSSVEQFKAKTKSHNFNMPSGSSDYLKRFR